MKKYLLLFLWGCLSQFDAGAQFTNCCTSLEIPSNGLYSSEFTLAGPGQPDPVSDCSCLEEDEHESFWFKFDCTEASILEFIIRTKGTGGEDFDFAVFESICPCGAGGPAGTAALACDFTAGSGPTGLGNPNQWGLPGAPNFFAGMPMEEGQTYFLLVDNKGNNDGFDIMFSSTSMIGQLPDPGPTPLTGPSQVCPGGEGIFMVPAVMDETYQWTVNGVQSLTNYTNTFDYIFQDVGVVEVCVVSYLDECFLSDPTCMTVEVLPIPVSTQSDTLCFPGPYVAENGEEFFSPGVYTLTFESFQGCDSLVTLTLDGFLPDVDVRAATICEGDCFDFEGELICEEGIYERVYKNIYGCDSVVSLNLIELPLEIVVEGEDTLDCIKTDLLLDASMSLVGGETSFLWENEAGDTIDYDSILYVNNPGLYTIEVTTVSGMLSCVEEKVIEIIADTEPPADVVAVGGSISCFESAIVLQASSTTPDVVYEWQGPGGLFTNEQNPTVSVVGTYTLTVRGENGCETIRTVEVDEIVEVLTATAAGGTINCYAAAVTLNGNSPDPGVSYNWTGPNNTTFSGPNPVVSTAGAYTLTVTDVNGCTGSAETIVLEDLEKPNAQASVDQVLDCNSTSVLLNGSGSSFGSAFGYVWSTMNGSIVSGETGLNPTVDAVGQYVLTVTNNENGCTETAEVTVAASPPVTSGISAQSDARCFGEENGSAAAFGGGGDGVYTYTWSNGMTEAMVDGLSEGTYVVTVTDGAGCTSSSMVTILQPSVLTANATATPQTMLGTNDGTAMAAPAGGTPGYTYMWSNGLTTPTIDGLAPGNYTVVITDDNGCQSEQTVTVNEVECFVTASTGQTDVTCNGFGDGTAVVNLTAATEPITFVWSNDETTQSIDDLMPGSYTVTATDANGCEIVTSVNIIEPAVLNSNATSTDQILPGMNDGTATANPTGGTSPYTYIWSNDETSQSIVDLPPGEYTVTVVDDNGCESVQEVSVEAVDCGVLLSLDPTDVSCFGFEDGQASVTPSGGLAPFTFEWSNGETTATIGNLAAGTYEVTVMDASDCPANGQVVIEEPTALTLELTATTPAACGSDNGTASVIADGGTPDYSYTWSNDETTETVENLAAGMYSVSVEDAMGCETVLDVEVVTDNTTDLEPPVAVAADFTVQLDGDGLASVGPMDIDNGSSDNCEIVSIELDVTSFDCDQVGANTVILTVTDIGGNVNTATAVVTVEDASPPVFENCPDNLTLPFCDPVALFDLTVIDNCSSDVPVTQVSGLPSGSTFPTGETTMQMFEVTDAGGNTANCAFEITVAPEMSVVPEIADVSCFGEGDGSIAVDVAGGLPGYTYLWSNDSTGVNINELGPGMYDLTVTDDAGCTTVEMYEVDEPTDLVTTLVNIINENGTAEDGSVDVTVDGGVTPYTYQWTDLNGEVVGTMEDISGLAAGTYQLFVTDSNGCVSSSAYTIQNTVGTFDPVLDAAIKVYPNPTSAWLTIELVDLPYTKMEIAIHDVVGHLVRTQTEVQLIGGKYLLDMGAMPEGVYLVEFTLEGSAVTKRVVRVD